MNPRLAYLLARLYPQPWQERYGAEFAALLEDNRGGLRTVANVLCSAMHERIFRAPASKTLSNENHGPQSSPFNVWCAKAPWAAFGLAPLLLLAGAYSIACLILWSGWGIFLPEANIPFVPVDGLAVFYFGIGRLLYYAAPILVGGTVGWVAARQRLNAAWTVSALMLVASIGGTAQVHANRAISGGVRHVSMYLSIGTSTQDFCFCLVHASIILFLALLPYLIWRLRETHSRIA